MGLQLLKCSCEKRLIHIGRIKYILSTSETPLFFTDCGTPAETGYTYTSTSGTTYGETSSVACTDGYEGTISTSTVTCEATGAWTDVTGCTIKGEKIVIIKYQPAK